MEFEYYYRLTVANKVIYEYVVDDGSLLLNVSALRLSYWNGYNIGIL